MNAYEPEPGTVVARYTLLSELGRSARGSVWHARQAGPGSLERWVAVRFLTDPTHDERDTLERLVAAAARVHHPNLVAPLEVRQHRGHVVVITDRIWGRPLTTLAAMSPRAVVEAAEQLCAAVQALHGHGDPDEHSVIHGAIRPSNLILDRRGLLHLADAGLALRGHTPISFAAPELDRLGPSPATDLYAVGATIAHLAGGSTASDPAPACDELVPGLGEIVRRCLARDPAARWPHASALALALRRLYRREHAGPALAAWAPNEVIPAIGSADPTVDDPDHLYGRDELLETVRDVLAVGSRLVWLQGAGGTGTSTLARAAARAWATQTGGYLGYVRLPAGSNLAMVCFAIARSLSMSLTGPDPVVSIGEALRQLGPMLWVLDDIDPHLADLNMALDVWVRMAPDLVLICTCEDPRRGALKVNPLELKDAVAMFRDHTDGRGDPVAVASLVERLGRSPLAIVLAVHRSRTVPLKDQVAAVSRRSLKRAPSTTGLARSLDASLELLPAWARVALTQLAVLDAPFTLESAQAILDLGSWRGAGWACDVVEVLYRARLIHSDVPAGHFHVHPAIRELVLSREPPEVVAGAMARRGRWFAQRVPPLGLSGQVDPAELPVLVATCREGLRRGDARQATRALAAVWDVVRRTGPFVVAADLAGRVLDLPKLPPELRVEAGTIASHTLRLLGQFDTAAVLLEESLEVARAAGEPQAALLSALGITALGLGEANEAAGWLLQAMGAAADGADVFQQAVAHDLLGVVEVQRGNLDAATVWFDTARDLAASCGALELEAVALANLGDTRRALERGGPADGLSHRAMARSCGVPIGHERVGMGAQGVALRSRTRALLSHVDVDHPGEAEQQLVDAIHAVDSALASYRFTGHRR